MSGVARVRPLMNLMRLETRMYGSIISKLSSRNQTRTLSSSHVCMDKASTTGSDSSANLGDFHHPSDFDKKVLVWTKMYPSVEAVPESISISSMKKGKDLFRIRINIGMILATAFGCCIMVYTGRKARSEGDSITKWGLAWQKRMQEQGRQEREAAAAAAETGKKS